MIGTEEIAEIVKVAAAEVLARKDEILDEEYDARYHDVNLLMKNYRDAAEHVLELLQSSQWHYLPPLV